MPNGAMEIQNRAMGYDRTATMFSPEGHLLQVEYAEKTVRLGSASIGFSCKDGVVIVADRRKKEELIKEESANKVFEVDEHIMASAAGILSDARVLVEKAQIAAQQHRVTYESGIEVESVVKDIANQKQLSTQYGALRPYGVSIMFAGLTNGKPGLYVVDVTGNYFEYNATAIGENDTKINNILKKEYKENITADEAIKLGLKIFGKVLGDKFKIERFDVGVINEEKKLRKISGKELKDYK